MKFGIFYELQLPRPWTPNGELKLYQDALTQVELADRLGYDYAPEVGSLVAPIIVNVTPIGMAGGPEENDLAFGAETIAKAYTVFDVVALPSETPLIKAARTAGVKVITGADVIALQAAEQFERYTGVRPTPEQIAEASAISRA